MMEKRIEAGEWLYAGFVEIRDDKKAYMGSTGSVYPTHHAPTLKINLDNSCSNIKEIVQWYKEQGCF
jgi:hypothetical protein